PPRICVKCIAVARPAHERVGRALRDALADAGLRQGDLADALGIDQGTVSRWTRGLQRIDLDYFPAIDKALGRPTGYLLRKAGYVADSVDTLTSIDLDPRLDDEARR